MNTKKALVFLAFIAFLALSSSAQAASTTESRYFVGTTSPFWQKSIQVRNYFNSGFTADLTGAQLWLAKLFGVQVTPVKKLNILATSSKSLAKIPVNQVGWGDQAIYGDTLGENLPSGGEGINVAILDTGAMVNHPDLKDHVILCDDLTSTSPLVKNSCADDNGHGTQIAGIVAADGGQDGNGIYGIAPGANLMIYKVCSAAGGCFEDDVASAITHATDDGANIILVSLGSDSESSLVSDAIDYATKNGVMVIAAAGNDGPYTSSIDYPAYNANVVSVGAVDQQMNVPDWSARGGNSANETTRKDGDLEFVAPGVNIESTSNQDDYVTSSGTSMAAAEIAGLAAKEWQGDAKDPASATRNLLHKFAQTISGFDATSSGWGMPQL